MESLPVEIIMHIIESIDTDETPVRPSSTLAHVCSVSRLFHRIGTPVLYRHIRQPSARFHGLLKTLWITPELRVHIKNVQDIGTPGDAWFQNWDHNGEEFRTLDPGLLVLLEKLAQELSIDRTTLSARIACPESVVPTICALIAPNVEHLRIVLNCWNPERGPEMCWHRCLLLEQVDKAILGNRSEGKPMFHHLRSLQLECDTWHVGLEEIDARTLTTLPSLETLQLDGWSMTWPFADVVTWPLRTSTISELSLRSHGVTAPVCNMILACKTLVKFESFPRLIDGEEQAEDWYSHLASALQEHRDTLLEIAVGPTYISYQQLDAPFFIPLPDAFDSLHGLDEMHCLIRLHIPWHALRGRREPISLAKTLPPSLKELTLDIRDVAHEHLHDALIDLLQECARGRFPTLANIHLLWHLSPTLPDFTFDVAKLQKLSQGVNVRFDITIFCLDVLSKPHFHLAYTFGLTLASFQSQHRSSCVFISRFLRLMCIVKNTI
jgi:hypothetical protein